MRPTPGSQKIYHSAHSRCRPLRSVRTYGRVPKAALYFVLVVSLLMSLSSCGKKGGLTLLSYEKPPAPVISGAYHREDRISISWSFPQEEEGTIAGFVLFRASDADFKKIAEPASADRTFTETDFRNGEHYRYKIVARNLRGMLSADSNILDVTPVQPPAPPEEVTFRISGNSLILSWTNEKKDVLYNVYGRAEKGKYGPPVNSVPMPDRTFKYPFEIDRVVCYTVRSLTKSSIGDEGRPSAEVQVDPFGFVPSAPKDVRAYAAPDRVFLYWDEPAESWVTHFRVYRKTGEKDYELIGDTQIPAFLDATEPLTARDYRVNAVGPAKEGPGSEVKGVVYTPQE